MKHSCYCLKKTKNANKGKATGWAERVSYPRESWIRRARGEAHHPESGGPAAYVFVYLGGWASSLFQYFILWSEN